MMQIRDLIDKIEEHATKSANAEAEFRQPADALFDIPFIADRLRKVRMWGLIACGVLIFGFLTNIDSQPLHILRALIGTAVLSIIGVTIFVWTTAKLGQLRGIILALKAQVSQDSEMREELRRLNDQSHERAIAHSRAQTMSNAEVAPIKSASVIAKQPDHSFKIRELQSRLEVSIRMLPVYERSDPYKAQRTKAEIAVLESKLRSLGA